MYVIISVIDLDVCCLNREVIHRWGWCETLENANDVIFELVSNLLNPTSELQFNWHPCYIVSDTELTMSKFDHRFQNDINIYEEDNIKQNWIKPTFTSQQQKALHKKYHQYVVSMNDNIEKGCHTMMQHYLDIEEIEQFK